MDLLAHPTTAQVISLTEDAMRNALDSEKHQPTEAGSHGLQSGVTIDLSRKNIQTLSDEVIDIVKDRVERLALSHNQISSLPANFSQCTSLRYLNIRGNRIKNFPMSLCDLNSLEILDLGRNQLQEIPDEIGKLSSLKVLSVQKNHLRQLPLCLADMSSLQVLKYEGNPIRLPSRDALQRLVGSPTSSGKSTSNEATEVDVTAKVKQLLRYHATNRRNERVATSEEAIEATEGVLPPLKQAGNGRFPIKLDITKRSNIQAHDHNQWPPPLPTASRLRGLSQQSAIDAHPDILPPTIASISERLRSNSETMLRSNQPGNRSRRMGVVPKRGYRLGALDQIQSATVFNSHHGVSQPSHLEAAQPGLKSPPPSTASYIRRPIHLRQLSIFPVRQHELGELDPIVEAASGIIYSIFQIHPIIQALMPLVRAGATKRPSLEIVLYNTNSHLEQLELELQKYHISKKGRDGSAPSEGVHQACQTLLRAYGHVCTLLAREVNSFIETADPRYIRTLLMLLYSSTMEVRATVSSLNVKFNQNRSTTKAGRQDDRTINHYVQDSGAIPNIAAPKSSKRSDNRNPIYSPGRSTIDAPVQLNQVADSNVNEKQESLQYVSNPTKSNLNSPEEDIYLNRIFLCLEKSTDTVLKTLPNFNAELTDSFRQALQQRISSHRRQHWNRLITMCNSTIQKAEIVKKKSSRIKQGEAVEAQSQFWAHCISFIESWTELVSDIMTSVNKIPFPTDTKRRLKPIQEIMKETSNAIAQSPWYYVLIPSGLGSEPASPPPTIITPQSAALGPAMQATLSIA